MDFYIKEVLTGLAVLFIGSGLCLAFILLTCIRKEKDHNKKDK